MPEEQAFVDVVRQASFAGLAIGMGIGGVLGLVLGAWFGDRRASRLFASGMPKGSTVVLASDLRHACEVLARVDWEGARVSVESATDEDGVALGEHQDDAFGDHQAGARS